MSHTLIADAERQRHHDLSEAATKKAFCRLLPFLR